MTIAIWVPLVAFLIAAAVLVATLVIALFDRS